MMDQFTVINLKNGGRGMSKTVFIAILVLLVTTKIASASVTAVPNTFSSGQTVSSSKINQNFDTLETAIDGKLGTVLFVSRTTVLRPNYGSFLTSGIASASCLPGEIATGVSCSCNDGYSSGDPGYIDSNLGTLYGCDFGYTGNYAMGACVADGYMSDTSLPGPAVSVTIVCSSVIN